LAMWPPRAAMPRRRGDDVGDAHARQSALKDVAVDAVAISVQPARCRVIGKRVDYLLSGPGGRRMIREVEMYDAAAAM
jgi:hypothetical protein